MFHVLQVSTGYSDGSLEAARIAAAGGTHTLISSQRSEDIIAAGQDADGLLVALTKVPVSLIEALPKLKLIVRAGIGVDNIDLAAAKARGIHVCNLPHYCQDEVADHTAALLLALERKLYAQVSDIKKGAWKPSSAYRPIHGLRNAVVGFVGFGGIARKVYERLLPFGARAMAYDPYLPREIAAASGVELTDLDTVLQSADFLSLHMPLTPETRNMLDAQAFAKMKDGAYLVNSARGPLVDNAALYDSIVSGRLAGAALDVIDGDIATAARFADFDNVLITPHSAYYSEQSSVKIRAQAGDVFAAYIRGEKLDSMLI